ncbi:cytochrome c oxidase assembly protein [Gordonia rhizosphera]|uniref:cytochrome c oxidase assembly protein n=1 Tax=Gordonia rhizosphera TaxID=83341 RepID=UPI0003105016|nr:cytochrome c oxidase assembly protein [Gordonia rhizosphera]
MSVSALRASRPAASTVIVGAAAVGALGLVVYSLISGSSRFVETGDSFPGWFTAVATPLGFFMGSFLGALVFGALAYVVLCARPEKDGTIGVETFRAHRIVEWAAPVWLLVCAVMVVVTAADRSGVPVGTLLTNAGTMAVIDASEQSVAWIVAGCFALIITIVTRLKLTWVSHALMLIPGFIAAVTLPVAGNAGQGPNHDYTTSAVIVFAAAVAAMIGLKIAAAVTVGRDTPPADRPAVARRVLGVAIALESIGVVYGALLLTFLVPLSQFATTAYGRWSLVAAALLVAGLIVDIVAWRRVRGTDTLPVSAGTSLMVGAALGTLLSAALAAMATRTAPGLLLHEFTAWDVFLGYELPDPPTVATLALDWRVDMFLGVGAIVLGTAYVVGVVRLRQQGVEWSMGRTASWLAGCVALLIVTSSGVRTYGMAMFSVHMAEHMALNMFVPVLLVLGAPVTLALRVFPTAQHGALPGPREWIVWMVHSRFTQILTNPVVALLIFVLSLYGVYFTSLFDTLARYHWGHDLMSLHFLITGYLFYWVIIGTDPGPKRLPYLARLGLLLAVMPFHAFFGIATMTMNSIIGGTFYRYLDLPWLADLSRDQFLGGAIAWGSSEVPAVLVVIALVSQWAGQDRRQAKQQDRRVDVYHDDELDAYNRMLAEMSRDRG